MPVCLPTCEDHRHPGRYCPRPIATDSKMTAVRLLPSRNVHDFSALSRLFAKGSMCLLSQPAASCGGKSVLVRQLRGPHLSTWPWWSSRSGMALTAAASPRSFPPVLHGTVRGQHGAGPLVAAHDDLQQFFGGGERQLTHAQIIDGAIPPRRSSSFKTLAMPTEPTSLRGNRCPGRYSRWPVFSCENLSSAATGDLSRADKECLANNSGVSKSSCRAR